MRALGKGEAEETRLCGCCVPPCAEGRPGVPDLSAGAQAGWGAECPISPSSAQCPLTGSLKVAKLGVLTPYKLADAPKWALCSRRLVVKHFPEHLGCPASLVGSPCVC